MCLNIQSFEWLAVLCCYMDTTETPFVNATELFVYCRSFCSSSAEVIRYHSEIKGNFTTHRLKIPFTEKCDINYAHVIESLALEGKFIKSSRSGLVSLGEKDDCGCWVRT